MPHLGSWTPGLPSDSADNAPGTGSGAGAIIGTSCGLGNRLFNMGIEMSLDPSVRFFWAPMEWTSKCVTPTKCNTAVVNMPFEELFEVSGQPLPFVQTLPKTVAVADSRWTDSRWLLRSNHSPRVLSQGRYDEARQYPDFVGLQCQPKRNRTWAEGADRCAMLQRLLPARVLHEPLQALRRRLANRSAPATLHLRNANESTDFGMFHPYRLGYVDVDRWARNGACHAGGIKGISTCEAKHRPFAYAAAQVQSDGLHLQEASHRYHPGEPPVLLQSDFRSATDGRDSKEGLLSAVFDLFALSLGSEVWSTHASKGKLGSSTFAIAASCLKGGRYWSLSDPYASVKA
jgi:hypothetical protein